MFTLQNHSWHYTGQVQVRIRRQSDLFRRITQQRTLATAYLRRQKEVEMVLFIVLLEGTAGQRKIT